MPKLKLTKTAVASLTPPNKGSVEYFDTDLPGFLVRVGKKTMTYYVNANGPDGKRKRVKLGTSTEITTPKARELAKTELSRRRENKVAPKDSDETNPGVTLTLNDGLELMLRERGHKLSERTVHGYRAAIHNHMSDWLDAPLVDINPNMVIDRYSHITRDSGHVAANTAIDTLRVTINYTSNRHVDSLGRPLIPFNPVDSIKALKLRNSVKRRKTMIHKRDMAQWFRDIYNFPDEGRRDLCLLMWQTGARRGEPESLEWYQVDMDDRTFTFDKTKNGSELRLPMSDFVYAMFAYRKREYGDRRYVFGRDKNHPVSDLNFVLRKLQESTDIRFTFHDLRRGFITAAEVCGVGYLTYKRLVNHKLDQSNVTAGYYVGEVESLRAPAQAVSDYLLECAGASLNKEQATGDIMAIDFNDRLLNTKEAAEYTGMSKGWFEYKRWMGAGGPPYIKVGRAIRYRLSSLNAWFDSREVEGAH